MGFLSRLHPLIKNWGERTNPLKNEPCYDSWVVRQHHPPGDPLRLAVDRSARLAHLTQLPRLLRFQRAGCLELLLAECRGTFLEGLEGCRVTHDWRNNREKPWDFLGKTMGSSRKNHGIFLGKTMGSTRKNHGIFLGKPWDFPGRFPSNKSNDMGSFFWVGKAWFMCGSSSKGLRCNQHAPPYSKKFV